MSLKLYYLTLKYADLINMYFDKEYLQFDFVNKTFYIEYYDQMRHDDYVSDTEWDEHMDTQLPQLKREAEEAEIWHARLHG
jgi:hypothetical protein